MLCIFSNAGAADARAWLDRNSMQLGETVTLNVELAGTNSADQPDFSVLQQDFNQLGTSSSSSMSIVNGQSSAKVLWAVGLEPKHAGTLTIPALSVGGAPTQALTLTVLPQAAAASGKAGDDVFIEISAEPRAPYVQQQVRCTLKLYYALNLTEGVLEDPHADTLVTQKLGQDKSYEANVGNRHYHVLERHYALIPEASAALTLPAVAFRGRALEAGDINSFFNHGRSISARSDAIALEVRPRPPGTAESAWLPAQSLSLSADGIDGATSSHVGEPITLTLRLQAQGLGFEQLPELKLPAIDGAQVYPDKPVTRNRDDGNWLYGERERKFAIVPTRAGSLSLPTLSLVWWDTVNDRERTVELAPTTITILPAIAAAAAPMAADAATAPAQREAPSASSPASAIAPGTGIGADAAAQLYRWRLLAFIALALWALTLAAWIAWLVAQRRRLRVATATRATAPADTRAARTAFRAACQRGDRAAAARALLAWARAERPQLRNLGELARALSDAAQTQAVGALQRALYGNAGDDGNTPALATAFDAGLSLQSIDCSETPASALPPLYPFRV